MDLKEIKKIIRQNSHMSYGTLVKHAAVAKIAKKDFDRAWKAVNAKKNLMGIFIAIGIVIVTWAGVLIGMFKYDLNVSLFLIVVLANIIVSCACAGIIKLILLMTRNDARKQFNYGWALLVSFLAVLIFQIQWIGHALLTNHDIFYIYDHLFRLRNIGPWLTLIGMSIITGAIVYGIMHLLPKKLPNIIKITPAVTLGLLAPATPIPVVLLVIMAMFGPFGFYF